MECLKKYKRRVEEELEEAILSMGEKTKLRDACEYSLLSGGKRLRPIITMLISDAIGKKQDVSFSALSVEFFHTASLIADDLPCMDDEKKRRNKLALHHVFGENIAILASYTFIALGYEMVSQNAKILKEKKIVSEEIANKLCFISIEEVSKVSGIFGATNGQFLDLSPPNKSIATLLKIIKQKTGTLFVISFILGWLFGGGDIKKLNTVKKAAYHFGNSFQIADDIKDLKKDKKKSSLNIASFLGKEKAKNLFQKEVKLFEKNLLLLNIFNQPFKEIIKVLQKVI